mgnify:CR=1 FL=1
MALLALTQFVALCTQARAGQSGGADEVGVVVGHFEVVDRMDLAGVVDLLDHKPAAGRGQQPIADL